MSTPSFYLDGRNSEAVQIMLEGWYHIADWQAQSLNYLIEHDNFEAVFSHYHNVDLQFIDWLTWSATEALSILRLHFISRP